MRTTRGNGSQLHGVTFPLFFRVVWWCGYSGSKGQHIKLWSTTTGDPMGTLRYHQGFLGQRIGPVSCLCFHRHKMFLAIGATDSIVSIYTGHQ